MPLYETECQSCGIEGTHIAVVDERHNTPRCEGCGGPTKLIISACAGVVRFPAGGGQEYRSPASGKIITTERARRDDLARTGSRQYEGFAVESAEAKRRVAYDEKKNDEKLEASTRRAFHALSPAQKKNLGGAA